jgi:hypothetical protein
MTTVTCTWCGNEVEAGEGYRLAEPEGGRVATFCRLEHVVPWALQGAHWEAGEAMDVAGGGAGEEPGACALCGATLTDTQLVLVRHRSEHRVADRFCSVDHLAEWAKKGGRWRT